MRFTVAVNRRPGSGACHQLRRPSSAKAVQKTPLIYERHRFADSCPHDSAPANMRQLTVFLGAFGLSTVSLFKTRQSRAGSLGGPGLQQPLTQSGGRRVTWAGCLSEGFSKRTSWYLREKPGPTLGEGVRPVSLERACSETSRSSFSETEVTSHAASPN
jgi:hypothetical protein